MDGQDQIEELGYLGAYGVVIVPPTPGEYGGWFVTLAGWNDNAETYQASNDGPILESREEAVLEANRVLDWLAKQGDQGNLMLVWEQMQRDLSRDQPWWTPPAPRDPPLPH